VELSELEEPDRPGQQAAARNVHHRSELPGPDDGAHLNDRAHLYDRGQLYELTRAHIEAEAPSYAAEVPRFQRMWADHQHRWPADHHPRTPLQLSPDRDAEATAAIARVREAEPAITADVLTVEQQNTCAARLEGIDHRLKGEPRLKEKLSLASTPDATAADILREIPDAIRYTFCLQSENYAKGYYELKEHLEGFGYEMYQSKNFWGDQEYKGINTRWITTESQRFEVQLHTTESFHAKQHVTHDAYERLRNPHTTDTERGELETFQREVSSRVRAPDGASDIPDFKKKGF
jgi:hypothetical protein